MQWSRRGHRLVRAVLGDEIEPVIQQLTHTPRCVSSEVYGNDASGNPNQWVGDLTTADANAENNGVTFNYTLTDASAYTWEQ